MRIHTRLACSSPLLVACLASQAAAQSVLYNIPGTSTDQRFGTAVAEAGDVNADGYPDLLVGAAGADTAGNESGAAFVYSGLTGALLWSWQGDAPGDGLGNAVDGAGDVNDDGYDDVIVGEYRHDGVGVNSGRALVFSGLDGSILHTLDATGADDEFGVGVAGLGDIDGDGFDDVAVGAHHDDDNGGNSGSVRVVSGATGGQLFLFIGDESGDDLGHVVTGVGDIDGDGVPDLMAGLHDTLDEGQARVYSGLDGDVIYNFSGSTPDDFYGHAVDGPGDINRDGVPDLLIGAELDDTAAMNAGRAWLRSGATGAVLFSWVGDAANDNLGNSVSGAGDWNGDGVLDLVLGIPGSDLGGSGATAARIVSGLDGSVLHTDVGNSPGPRFDIDVAGVGDCNGDARPDVLLGQPYHDQAFTDGGLGVVLSGALPRWTPLGGGLLGVDGIPSLLGTGLLLTGSPGTLKLTHASPASLSLLAVSLANNPTGFKCGTLITVPVVFQVPLVTGGAGNIPLAWPAWPAGLSGFSLYFQYAIADAAAVCGVSISTALRGDVP